MTLLECRCTFSRLITEFQTWLTEQGYVWNEDEGMNHQGKGHRPGSVHYEGCAKDINLFDKDLHYLGDNLEAYRPLGDKWKSMDPENNFWGGDFKNERGESNPDVDHFSRVPFAYFKGRK